MTLLYLSLVADFVGFCSKLLPLNLWAQRSLWKGDSCWFLQILWEGQCWKEAFVLQDLVYILCIDIQIVKNQEKQLMLGLYSLWIFYLNVIFTFVSCVSFSCFSGFQKEKKKSITHCRVLSALKLFQTKIGWMERFAVFWSDFVCLLLSITHSFSEHRSFTRKMKIWFKVNCWAWGFFSFSF